MKHYTHKKSDGTIVVTKFDKNKSYTKEYANSREYNRSSMRESMTLVKILIAPIYYPVKFVFKILYMLIKGFYWDLPRFIYFKMKK